MLHPPSNWVPVDQASISYGYGISVTPLQLARAYAALASGQLPTITLRRRDVPSEGMQVFAPTVAQSLRQMLELAVGEHGTGGAARVADYRVAGKTGTVRKLTANGYSESEYISWFAGFAPVHEPRLAMVIAIDTPTRGAYFGGEVAAPVFGHVMSGALRLLDIPPDAPRRPPVTRLVSAKPGKEL